MTTQATQNAEDQLVGILNDACLALMVSIGHRTGLFTALADAGPVTVEELALQAGLQERYVREWLGAMTVGGLVRLDLQEGAYRLDADHAAVLTGRGAANLAAFSQYVAVLAEVEDEVVVCFRDGGGVPYEHYPRMAAVTAEDSAQTVVPALHDVVLPLVPGLTERLAAGIDVLDVGCGLGRTLLALARDWPASRFTGVDLSEADVAQASDAGAGVANLSFRVGDAARLGELWKGHNFDLVATFDAIHDFARPREGVAAIHGVLRPDGTYLAQDVNTSGTHAGDVDHPFGPFLYTISCLHCMTVSLAQGGPGLGATWGRPAAEELLAKCGFAVTTHVLPNDPQSAWYVCAPLDRVAPAPAMGRSA